MDKKIKMLVVPSDGSGVGFHRSIWPHQYIQEHYGDEFDIDIVYMKDFPRENITDFFKQYDLIHVHKQFDKGMQLMNMIKFLDIPVILDLDDAYQLGPDHPLHITAKREGWAEVVINHAKMADYITTTTPIYAEKLKKLNKNVAVHPNAINTEIKQFNQSKKKSNKIRFGLICGSTHLKDIQLMGGLDVLPNDVMDKVQFVLCGFDTRGQTTIYDKTTGQVTQRPIKPEESVWCRYEEFLTKNYKNISPEHKDFLKKYIAGVDDPFENESYRRCWTRDIQHYATHYENVDVLLAPLKENDFNSLKSQLKFTEAGFTDTAIIASNFGPYTIDSVPYLEKGNVVNPNGNCLLVESSKNHKQWGKYIKYLVEHPEAIETIKNNLARDMKAKYSMEAVCKDRVELYKKIVEEKKNKNA